MNKNQTKEDSSLHYLAELIPGITREKQDNKFIYLNPDQSLVSDTETLERIQALAIPPAYTEVWISPLAHSHIQATARDSKNRKQYRYHPQWRALREENKFMNMRDFGKALPKIRHYVKKALNKPLKMNKEQIMCAIIYLLDNYFIRIGNVVYEKENQSYGLTTLRKKHLVVSSSKATLKFKGKNLKAWEVVLEDKKIIKVLKKCESLPGYKLFKYFDKEQKPREITSADINTFLQSITKHSFTAKDFRTWGACRETFYHLSQISSGEEGSARKQLGEVITKVATLLGHSTAICQKSYIYPEIITHWKEEKITKWLNKHKKPRSNKDKLFLHWLETLK